MAPSLRTIVESPVYTRQAGRLTAEERTDIAFVIALDPEAGDIIPRTGGARKLRWAPKGQGKRGGARVIYYFPGNRLFLLAIYFKNEKTTLSEDEKKILHKVCKGLK